MRVGHVGMTRFLSESREMTAVSANLVETLAHQRVDGRGAPSIDSGGPSQPFRDETTSRSRSPYRYPPILEVPVLKVTFGSIPSRRLMNNCTENVSVGLRPSGSSSVLAARESGSSPGENSRETNSPPRTPNS